MILKFFVNRFNCFDLFEEQAGHAVEAACFFKEVTAQGRGLLKSPRRGGSRREYLPTAEAMPRSTPPSWDASARCPPGNPPSRSAGLRELLLAEFP